MFLISFKGLCRSITFNLFRISRKVFFRRRMTIGCWGRNFSIWELRRVGNFRKLKPRLLKNIGLSIRRFTRNRCFNLLRRLDCSIFRLGKENREKRLWKRKTIGWERKVQRKIINIQLYRCSSVKIKRRWAWWKQKMNRSGNSWSEFKILRWNLRKSVNIYWRKGEIK